jgi:hypothetical protein
MCSHILLIYGVSNAAGCSRCRFDTEESGFCSRQEQEFLCRRILVFKSALVSIKLPIRWIARALSRGKVAEA